MTSHDPALTDEDYHSLAEFRHALRRFLAFSDNAAREHDITPAQHQLLLAIRGSRPDGRPSTSDEQHSARGCLAIDHDLDEDKLIATITTIGRTIDIAPNGEILMGEAHAANVCICDAHVGGGGENP